MTHLAARKSVMRTATNAQYCGRQLVIELHPDRPHELFVREARRRHGYHVPILAIYQLGGKIAARERQDFVRSQRGARRLA